MEEKIYQKIVAGLGKTSLSERTVRAKASRIANKYKTEDEVTDEVITDAVDDLKDMNGQYNNDVAKTVKEQVEKQLAEKQRTLTDGKTEQGGVESPDDVKAKLAKIDEITAFYEQDKAERKVAADKEKMDNLISSIREMAKKQKCEDGDILDLIILKSTFDVEKSIEDNFKPIQTQYDEKITSRIKAGYAPMDALILTPKNVSEDDRKKNAEARYDRLKKENRI